MVLPKFEWYPENSIVISQSWGNLSFGTPNCWHLAHGKAGRPTGLVVAIETMHPFSGLEAGLHSKVAGPELNIMKSGYFSITKSEVQTFRYGGIAPNPKCFIYI